MGGGTIGSMIDNLPPSNTIANATIVDVVADAIADIVTDVIVNTIANIVADTIADAIADVIINTIADASSLSVDNIVYRNYFTVR